MNLKINIDESDELKEFELDESELDESELDESELDVSELNESASIEKKIKHRLKLIKIKKMIVLLVIIFLILVLIIFGTINTFFQTELTAAEITTLVNNQNRTTPFPSEGLQGFLEMNLEYLISNNIATTRIDWSISDINIIRIERLSVSLVHVLFSAAISAEEKTIYNMSIYIYFNWQTGGYHPASEVEILIRSSPNSQNIRTNPFMSFSGISLISNEISESSGIFMNNFLILVLNLEGDYSQMYSGTLSLGQENLEFLRITSWEHFESPNRRGFNARIRYLVRSNNGLEYSVLNYLLIEPIQIEGHMTWVVRRI